MLERESLIQAVREQMALSAADEVVSAFLFGSRAEGREHQESDIDIAVLLRPEFGPRRRFETRLRLISDLIGALHVNEVDVVVLNDAPPLFARRIVLDGEQFYCSDADIDHAFRRDVQLLAADLAPFIERSRRGLLAAIDR